MGRRTRHRQPDSAAEARSLTLREKLGGHEQPGAVLRGPPITVQCDCGNRRDLAYGEVWLCDCGRRWNTEQIPREEYEAIRRTQLRFRVLPIALGLLVSCLAVFFLLTHNAFSLFILLPMSLVVWMTLLRPAHRKRYRAAIAHRPDWKLWPE